MPTVAMIFRASLCLRRLRRVGCGAPVRAPFRFIPTKIAVRRMVVILLEHITFERVVTISVYCSCVSGILMIRAVSR